MYLVGGGVGLLVMRCVRCRLLICLFCNVFWVEMYLWLKCCWNLICMIVFRCLIFCSISMLLVRLGVIGFL